jgi:hypothetical protein
MAVVGGVSSDPLPALVDELALELSSLVSAC